MNFNGYKTNCGYKNRIKPSFLWYYPPAIKLEGDIYGKLEKIRGEEYLPYYRRSFRHCAGGLCQYAYIQRRCHAPDWGKYIFHADGFREAAGHALRRVDRGAGQHAFDSCRQYRQAGGWGAWSQGIYTAAGGDEIFLQLYKCGYHGQGRRGIYLKRPSYRYCGQRLFSEEYALSDRRREGKIRQGH